jgi:hypothetical protein
MLSYESLTQQVKCYRCHWQGELGQLHFTTISIPYIKDGEHTGEYDTSSEPCCPACKSINIIIKEN